MDLNAILKSVGAWFGSSGLKIVIIVLFTLLMIRGAETVSSRLVSSYKRRKEDDEFRKRKDTLKSLISYALKIIVFSIAIAMILGELGVKIGPILAAAGVFGLAVGFGAQSLVKDIISGFFIFLEDQIRVGDVIQVAGKSGVVEKVNLKMTILRDLAGNVHFIPNGHIDVVTNMTKGYSRYVFDIGVAYREDVDQVMQILKDIGQELAADPDFSEMVLEPLEILGLDAFADSAVVIKTMTKTMPLKQWAVAREFRRRVKKTFDEKGIEIPFPHRTVYMGEAENTGKLVVETKQAAGA